VQVARPDDDVGALAHLEHRAQIVRLVRQVGIHRHEPPVAAHEPPLEALAVGAAEPEAPAALENVDATEAAAELEGKLRGAVG